jgi:hypothetical protein
MGKKNAKTAACHFEYVQLLNRLATEAFVYKFITRLACTCCITDTLVGLVDTVSGGRVARKTVGRTESVHTMALSNRFETGIALKAFSRSHCSRLKTTVDNHVPIVQSSIDGETRLLLCPRALSRPDPPCPHGRPAIKGGVREHRHFWGCMAGQARVLKFFHKEEY